MAVFSSRISTDSRCLNRSGFYPGIHYMLGSWYTPQEIGKRAMIFWLAGSVGTMFSGFLQAAAYTNLDGVHGYAGWRWLFIIDGIITLPLALAGFIFFPNDPQDKNKTWWISQAEHELAASRMKSIGRAGKKPWTKEKAKRIFTSWHTYLLRESRNAVVFVSATDIWSFSTQPLSTSCGTMGMPSLPWVTG